MNRPRAIGSRRPRYVAPMLAQPGAPFDSADFLFEVKWDGTRALAFIEEGNVRLLSRHGLDRHARFRAKMEEGETVEVQAGIGWPSSL